MNVIVFDKIEHDVSQKPVPSFWHHALVTGEAEQMPPIVHELVHIHALYDRCGAFFSTNEVYSQNAEQSGKNDPGQNFANRKGKRSGRRY